MNKITDVGCILEQEVLMTGTMADKTTSSTRGLGVPDDPSPEEQLFFKVGGLNVFDMNTFYK